ncbi:NAD(P)/FAD-dependent oxidoreductase [Solilutibacter silvestris]|uniref:NADH dehydrogenase FAD-containing subunit n=1 Tax=Solilutibacter silvestris TaxID=1645665 RepID=A0A2K1Q339_9GAMM|nr:NAD(P)/FAD-dependent oxidoreductase [Lysobacter silvestris]PNS09469.1 NADH dehydrogenase FAD-containing subunit [Lysobacter silvestris]
MHRIIVVGGGAGGLELATRLGDRYGRRRRSPLASITLVDRYASHLWKPLLHEVAAGSMDAPIHQVDYAAQAYWHGFEFNQGAMTGLDRAARVLKLDQVVDDQGVQIFPARELPYDTLVIAVGSTTNYFGVPGAQEYAYALDTVNDAEQFRRRLLAACARAHRDDVGDSRKAVRIVIVGGGATGVELAAELRQTAQVLSVYGLHRLDPVRDIGITIVEAGPRILGALPERVSSSAAALLREYDIDIATREQVAEVTVDGLRTAEGKFIGADLIVWAAGIKALPVLADLDGLAVGKRGQLIVRPTLQCENDDAVFALGDCAQCNWEGPDSWVPPRAQAAHQQASFLVRAIAITLREGARAKLPAFHYRDLGSLVSLGRLGATGNLMGGLIGGKMFVDGLLARLMYVSLYRMHTVALHGWWRTGIDVAANFFRRTISPRVKLH